MRLTEINEKVKNVRVPGKVFQEIWANEIDTIGPNSPSEKHRLADEMNRAEQSGVTYKVPLSTESKEYLMKKSLPNLIDIARDNLDGRLVNSLQKFQARLHAKLVGAEK